LSVSSEYEIVDRVVYLQESRIWLTISICQFGSSTQLLAIGCESRRNILQKP